MTCTRCSHDGASPRREHAERVLCDTCAALPPLVDWQNPPSSSNGQHGNGLEADAAAEWQEWQAAIERRQKFRTDMARADGRAVIAADWLEGEPMDPSAVPPEPGPTVPGFPFLPGGGGGAVIVGPTGGGRSSLLQACAYDAGRAGVSVAVCSGEVVAHEFNARAADVADRRGDPITDELREQLARVRFLDLATVIRWAWDNPQQWAADVAARYQVVGLDPLSTVASALELDFDKSNAEFVAFYDRIVQPLVARGVWTVMLENIGHAVEAKSRAKGASAKSDRADLTFSCALQAQPAGLILTARKVRSVRAPFGRGAEWVFVRDTQRIEARTDAPDGFRPTVLMDRLLAAATAEPGMTSRELRAAVKGNNTAKSDALRILIAEGHLDVQEDGPTIRHYVGTRGACSQEGVPTVPPRSHAVPTPSLSGCSPVPPDVRRGNGERPTDQQDRDRAERLLADHPDLNGRA